MSAVGGGLGVWGGGSEAGVFGRSERNRTFDPCLPKAVLYQAELHSDQIGLVIALNRQIT